jgi:hypothetical protein
VGDLFLFGRGMGGDVGVCCGDTIYMN